MHHFLLLVFAIVGIAAREGAQVQLWNNDRNKDPYCTNTGSYMNLSAPFDTCFNRASYQTEYFHYSSKFSRTATGYRWQRWGSNDCVGDPLFTTDYTEGQCKYFGNYPLASNMVYLANVPEPTPRPTRPPNPGPYEFKLELFAQERNTPDNCATTLYEPAVSGPYGVCLYGDEERNIIPATMVTRTAEGFRWWYALRFYHPIFKQTRIFVSRPPLSHSSPACTDVLLTLNSRYYPMAGKEVGSCNKADEMELCYNFTATDCKHFGDYLISAKITDLLSTTGSPSQASSTTGKSSTTKASSASTSSSPGTQPTTVPSASTSGKSATTTASSSSSSSSTQPTATTTTAYASVSSTTNSDNTLASPVSAATTHVAAGFLLIFIAVITLA